MTDLVTVLADFDTAPFANVLPSLERTGMRVSDLLALDAVEVAKQAQLPAREVRRLTDALLDALLPHSARDIPAASALDLDRNWTTISSLDDRLDEALAGGFPAGYLSEITGESGAGKTHLLLTLLLAVQLPSPHGFGRSAIYVSTEARLPTSRLNQLLNSHPLLQNANPKPSLGRILSISTPDLEAQEHILRYQLPVAIRRHNVGLVVIDSITANFRAEFEQRRDGPGMQADRAPAAMARRSAQLIELGALLRTIAQSENVAIVVANQVADRFTHITSTLDQAMAGPSQAPSSAPSSSAFSTHYDAHDPMTLDHQQRWFTGWGNDPAHRWSSQGLKTPSLGLVWTNQLACRVALTRRLIRGTGANVQGMLWKRHLQLVFAPWAPDHAAVEGAEFEITKEGIASLRCLGAKS